MSDIWTVIRHPGRGGDENWHTICMTQGEDEAEDRIRKFFAREAGGLRTGIVVLTCNGSIIDQAGPPWLRKYLDILISQMPNSPDERKDARSLPIS